MYVDVEGIAYTFDGCLVKAILAYKTKPDEKIPCGRRWATHMLEYVQGRTGAEWAYIAESAKCVYLANGNVHKFVPVQHLLPDGVYSNKVKFCVAQCIEFQREKYTWCPARPCCLPNLWLRPRQAPSRHQMLPCFFKLDQEQKQQFRAFVGSPEAKRWKSFENTAAMRRWLRLLHPERALLQEANGGDLEQLKIRNGQMKKVRRRLWSGSVMLQTPTRPTEVVDLETSHQAAQPVREPRGTRRDVDRHVGNRGLVPGAERRAAKRIEGLGPEGTSRGKVTLRQGLKELPEMCKPDPQWKYVPRMHPKAYQLSERTARLLERKRRMQLVGGTGSSGSSQVARPTKRGCSGVPSPSRRLRTGTARTSSRAPVTVRVSSRQSGVRGVTWDSRDRRWRVHYGGRKNPSQRSFTLAKHRKPGMSEEDADRAALAAAIAFRRSKEASMPRSAGHSAGTCPGGRTFPTKGVTWFGKAWYARIKVKNKDIHGGCFKPKDDSPEEVEKARLVAVAHRRALERKYHRVLVGLVDGPEGERKRRKI